MKTKVLSSVFVLFTVLFSASSSAVPVTMELETLTADQDTPFIEEGFAIEAPGEHLHATFNSAAGLPGAFSNAAQMAADTTGSTLTRVGGGAFNMISLEAVNIFGTDFLGPRSTYAVKIEGLFGAVSQGVTLLSTGTVAVIDFSSWMGPVDLVQFSYESQGSFGNVSSFAGDDFKFDNIIVEAVEVAPVPVPAAVWMFLSALSGLGLMRKKQAVA